MLNRLLLICVLIVGLNEARAFEFPNFMFGKSEALHLEGTASYDRLIPFNCRWNNDDFFRQSWANITIVNSNTIRIGSEFLSYFHSQGVKLSINERGYASYYATKYLDDGTFLSYMVEVTFDHIYRPSFKMFYTKKELANHCREKYGTRFSISVEN